MKYITNLFILLLRYYFKHIAANGAALEFIADNIVELLSSSYKHIIDIPKKEIPFAVQLKE